MSADLEKRVILMQGLLDSYGIRINSCEINSKQALEKVLDKPEKRDIFDLKEDLRILKSNVQTYFSQSVDVEKWQKLIEHQQQLNRFLQEYGNKADFDEQIEKKLQLNNKEILQRSQNDFLQNVKQIQIGIKKAQNDCEKLKIQMAIKLEKQDLLLAEFKQIALNKISPEYLEIYTNDKLFTKKEEEQVELKLSELKKDFQNLGTRVEYLTSIINKFDYEMLFRASKMEFESLSQTVKDIESNQIELLRFMLGNELRDMNQKVKNEMDRMNISNLKIIKEFLREEAVFIARQEFIEYFKGLDIQKLKQQLIFLENGLDTKISKEEFTRLEQQKQSKSSAEIFANFMQQVQIQMKNLVRSNLQFLRLFDMQQQQQSFNLKNINRDHYYSVIKDFEGTLLHLEQLNLPTNYRKPTKEMKQSHRLKTQNISPRQLFSEEPSTTKVKSVSIDTYPSRAQTSLKYPSTVIPSVKLRPLLDNLNR